MKWTDDQQAAIEAPRPGQLRSQTLLVAAAAGSGKTAVLVERIISRLKDKASGLSVDELLVMTFTRAAAAEMSARIGAALSKELSQATPEDREHLEKQLGRLPSAHISTFDSFCQWVVRSYFYRLNMDPDFTLADEDELSLIATEVLDEVLLKAYESGDYAIFDLVDMICDNNSDEALKSLIINLYTFVYSLDNPKVWLKRMKEAYSLGEEESLQQTLWGKALWEDQASLVKELQNNCGALRKLLNQEPELAPWSMHVESVEPFLQALVEAQTWEAMSVAVAALATYKPATFAKKSKAEESLKSEFKAIASANKEIIKAILKGPFSFTEEQWKAVLQEQQPLVVGLIELTEAFDAAYSARKEKEKLFGFADIVHRCLSLLGTYDENLNAWQPTALALELRDNFKEIMVDEYQDTNGVQEAIVNLISRKDNRFFVGDVKQAIYRFRMADPTLFLEKYKTFLSDLNAEERRIDLAQNFRSHENILEATNFIFRQIMTEEAAELSYGDKEALVPGRSIQAEESDNWVGGDVEVHLLEDKDSSEEGEGLSQESVASDLQEDTENGEELAGNERVTQFIIEKIEELKHEGKQVQNPDGTFRPLEYKDIVILMRSTANRAEAMVEAFRRASIPAYTEGRTGYFGALEVKIMLSLLQAIDNPEQDLAMAVVLRSPIVGLDAQELARLKTFKEGLLWHNLPAFAEAINHQKLKTFVEHMAEWRTLSRREGVSVLLQRIYRDTGYVDYVSAMPQGLIRRANLIALMDRAKQYENGRFRGLFRFLRFIERLRENGKDLGVAKTASASDNVVRIMTIHKSKGLEFPVVFVVDLQKKFNQLDLRSNLLLHKEAGIGLKGYYPKYHVTYPTLPWMAIRQLIDLSLKAEEERILYVALTRAKDKLFLVGRISTLENAGKVACKAVEHSEIALPKELILGSNSYLSWILLSLARHRAGECLRQAAGADSKNLLACGMDSSWEVFVHNARSYCTIVVDEVKGLRAEQDKVAEKYVRLNQRIPELSTLPQELVDRLTYEYAHKEAEQIAAKISVTEIKRRFAEREEEALGYKALVREQGLEEEPQESLEEDYVSEAFAGKPAFLVEKEGLSATAKGSAVHLLMQLLLPKEYTDEELRVAVEAFEAKGHFSSEERKILPLAKVKRFFRSALGQRMIKSELVKKELSFSLLLEANRIYREVSPEERVFLQGVMDMAFLEKGEWVLVDYKTDAVRDREALKKRYRIQMELYKEALARLTGKPVKEAYLFSFSLEEAIEI